MNNTQFITPPPDIPLFVYKRSASALVELIKWANKEWIDRVKYCAHHGYLKEHTRLTKDYSPIRILAEIPGYRKICANVSQSSWDGLNSRQRSFIRRALELRDLLLR